MDALAVLEDVPYLPVPTPESVSDLEALTFGQRIPDLRPYPFPILLDDEVAEADLTPTSSSSGG